MTQKKTIIAVCVMLFLSACVIAGMASSYRTLRVGSSGEDVLLLKARMYALGYFTSGNYSDYYNETTKERVSLLQKVNGLAITGIATPELQELIFSDGCVQASGMPGPTISATAAPADAGSMPSPAPASAPPFFNVETPGGYRTLREGDSGADVLTLKQRMYWLGYFAGYDSLTEKYNGVMAERVRLLQGNNGLEETGVATPELQALVYSGYASPAEKTPQPTAVPKPTPSPIPTVAPVTGPRLPALAPDGFIPANAGEQEFVYRDVKDGHWIYLSPTLSVEIKRYSDPNQPMVWFETEVRVKDGTKLTSYLTEGRTAGYQYAAPAEIARKNRVVLGVTDDFFGYRWRNGITMGIIIRNGQVISDKTYKANYKKHPCLETLAVFRDGGMKTYLSDAYTAQEYLDMGATDVFSFGPILVTNGEPGPRMSQTDYYVYPDPRCALGMIEQNHYIILTVNGRSRSSDGATMIWLAERMLQLGAKEALNLDGGGTVSLVFMGDTVNKGGTADTAGNRNVRKVTSIIGFGTSGKVAE